MTRTRPSNPHLFVMVTTNVLDTAAWKSMSTGARCLYIALKRKYNQKTRNNGKLYLSQREAMKALGRDSNQVARWYRELQHYGFIRMTEAGALGVDGKGRAPRWRLTELPVMRDGIPTIPTRDFDHWSGTKFNDYVRPRKMTAESRKAFPRRTV